MVKTASRDCACPPVETRVAGTPRIEGYAAVFWDGSAGTQFELQPGLQERIMPGAFDRLIDSDADVLGLRDHDKGVLLGRRSAGTLRLSVDSRGLKYSIDAPDTTAGRDTLVSLRRGDLRGSSFSFAEPRDEFLSDGSTHVRAIRDFGLVVDVGPVATPAYAGTLASARSIEGYELYRARRRLAVLLKAMSTR